MAYTAEINRSNPTAFLFLIDQSGSMNDQMSSCKSKAEQVADVLNRTLASLIIRCTKAEGVRDYFEIGVIGYGGNGVYNAFQGMLGSSVMHPISAIEKSPLRIEERKKKMDDGAGGIIEQSVKFPVWFEPHASGGTPMCLAITKAVEELVPWCDSHPNSYPPTVLHITDGESTDGDPEELTTQLRQIQTNDGSLLTYNLHVSTSGANPIEFPASEMGLPDAYAKLLFRMSSQLPAHLIRYAQERGYTVGTESRGFMFNGDIVQIVEFFDIGTRASQLR
ncbi:VWA domain-containing protein [Methylacidiphilum caldifontis]|uniref:vWA domain-containing protein n=1 Tax=Methylacidiphilum caldifontis TaxID=2795386 RepID=UPI001A8EE10F|nr:vWA domain-containing protein [Methylacidiphilum caldifontis]QSR89357.1 VWA domain-containing protein [Methylacidiphilum caldifontis]